MVTFNINIRRKVAVFFVAFFAVTLGIGVVIAYNPSFFGGVPSEFGHSSDEVMVKIGAIEKTLQEAINNNDFGAGGGGGSGIETFESGELTIVEGINIGGPHGLTKVFGAEIWLVNKVAEDGYSPGDEVLYSSGGNQGNSQGSNQYAGANLRVDGNNIFVRIPSSGINIMATPDGSNHKFITYSNWKMVIRAWGVGGSGTVDSSLGIPGYIKYGNGLIMQWGQSSTCNTITLPISFTNANSYSVMTGAAGQSENHVIGHTRISGSQFSICSDGGIGVGWFAIGT